VDPRRVFLSVSAIVFAASAAMTIAWCTSMSAMGEMEMPGGWTMSHMWMPAPGQTRSGAAASFVGMWVVMMVAMMLPSLTPALWCYRESVAGTGRIRTGFLTALVGVGYFTVWAALGVIVFPVGVVLAERAMREPDLSRTMPIAAGAVVLIAGLLQQTGWKARHLAFCRSTPVARLTPPGGAGAAWRHGVRLGLHCGQSCASLTAVALTLGIMDLRVMAAVAIAITAERLAPAGRRVAQAIGVVIVGAGVLLCAAVMSPISG
jgi:predicted metal-binding membrane protein